MQKSQLERNYSNSSNLFNVINKETIQTLFNFNQIFFINFELVTTLKALSTFSLTGEVFHT